EADACGIPVIIGPTSGAASELMEHNRSALVLKDAVDAVDLASSIRRVFDEPGLADRLRREGRAFSERHTWDANADAAAALVRREITTPRVLVLAPDPGGIGGIE